MKLRKGKERSQGPLFISGPVILIVLGLVLYPLLMLFLFSLGINLHDPNITGAYYLQALSDIKTMVALKNTLYVAGGVTAVAILLGGGLAWLVARTDIPHKRLIEIIVFLTFTIPSYILAVAWIQLLGRNGFINRLLYEKWQFIAEPLDIYSLEGIILVMALHSFPLVFMALVSALKMNDKTLEMAARLAGASRMKALFTVTLPLMLPNILSVGLLVFQQTMACFGVAAVIGLPTSNYVLTTRIYSAMSRLDLPSAASTSMILLLCSGVVFCLYNYSLRSKRYININSQSRKAEPVSLGSWKMPMFIGVFLLLSVTTIIPLGSVVATSFLKSWGLSLRFENMTINNYLTIFGGQTIAFRAFFNSITFAFIAATVTAIIGTIISYLSTRTTIKGRKYLEFVATWPLTVPGTVLAVAAVLAWINAPLRIYGTPWILLITYIVACLPFGVRNINGLLQGMDPLLEDAARVSGASWLRTFKDITLPLITPGIKAGWITAFLLVLREIPISILLYSAGAETIGVLLYSMRSDTGGLETVSAVAVILIVLIVAGNVLIGKFGKPRKEATNDPS